ncbi:TonB-dependent receptor [Undibacterium sp. Ji50W]|uniref:TonB-dependent receptor n=1 Tax=Undibacterium sp. Ji50W TaxID=3413041 RepID=UPI003BF00191
MKSESLLQKKRLASAIALAFGVGHAMTLHAQTAGKEEISTVTVTAQGRKENILKIPYNISSLSGQDLEEKNITDQTEMLRSVAGASIVDRGNRNSGVISGVTMRGLNVNGSALGDFQTSAVPTVSTYVNNTPLFANFLIKDVDRVEVLRGPQGTLYGSGSLGGTVRYITRRPELNTYSAKIDSSISRTNGSEGTNYTADGVFNVPLGELFALRLAAGKVNNAGVIDYPNVYVLDSKGAPVAPNGILDKTASYRSVKDADTVKIDYARLSLLAKPNTDFQALFTYQTQTDDVGGRRQPTIGNNGYGVPYGQYENGSVQLEPSTRDVKLAALEMDLDLGFATLSSGTSHYDQKGSSLSENTGFYAKNAWLANYYYNYPRPMAQAVRSYGDKAFVQEIRLVSKKGNSVDYIVGAYYQNQDLNAAQFSYLRGLKAWSDVAQPKAGVTSDNDFVFQRAQNFKERALFGELTWNLSPALRVTGGMRSFKTDFNNDSILGSGVIAPYNATTHTVIEQNDSGNLYKGNISWDFADKQMLYMTASQGYRRAGANAVPLTGNFAENKAWQTFKPDTNTNVELGIKGASGSMRYNVSLFHIDWKNIQIDTTTPNWGFYVAQNGGKASSQGLEAELSGRFGEGWRYTLSYAYVDAKLDEDVRRADNPAVITAKAGTVLPGTAKNTLSASLEHTMTFDNGLYWTNRINAYYQGSTENAISSSALVKKTWDSFSQWGLSSTLMGGKWSATFFVKNLTNNAGITGGFLEASMGTSPSQNYYGNGSKVLISQPRTIGFSANYNF